MAAKPQITLQAGRQSIPFPSPPADVAAMTDAYNRHRRIAGLPDDLNPAIIDPAKAAGLVAGLAKQSPAVAAKLAGNAVPLDWAPLGLGATAPTRREPFDEKFELIVDDVDVGQVGAHTSIPFDPQLARAKAVEAQAALAQAEAAIVPGTLDTTRFRRSAIAQTWLNNAEVWAKAEPGNPAAQSSLAAANKAFTANFMPKGIE